MSVSEYLGCQADGSHACMHLCALFMCMCQFLYVYAYACVCVLAAKRGEQEEEEARWLEGVFIYSLPSGLRGFRGTWQHLSWALQHWSVCGLLWPCQSLQLSPPLLPSLFFVCFLFFFIWTPLRLLLLRSLIVFALALFLSFCSCDFFGDT